MRKVDTCQEKVDTWMKKRGNADWLTVALIPYTMPVTYRPRV